MQISLNYSIAGEPFEYNIHGQTKQAEVVIVCNSGMLK
jgi:hypothetical protein